MDVVLPLDVSADGIGFGARRQTGEPPRSREKLSVKSSASDLTSKLGMVDSPAAPIWSARSRSIRSGSASSCERESGRWRTARRSGRHRFVGGPSQAIRQRNPDRHPAHRRREQRRCREPAHRRRGGEDAWHQDLHHRRGNPRRGSGAGAGRLRPHPLQTMKVEIDEEMLAKSPPQPAASVPRYRYRLAGKNLRARSTSSKKPPASSRKPAIRRTLSVVSGPRALPAPAGTGPEPNPFPQTSLTRKTMDDTSLHFAQPVWIMVGSSSARASSACSSASTAAARRIWRSWCIRVSGNG